MNGMIKWAACGLVLCGLLSGCDNSDSNGSSSGGSSGSSSSSGSSGGGSSSSSSSGSSSSSSGAFVRVWGSSTAGIVDGGPTVARFSNPAKVVVAPDNTVYVADYDNNLVRAISPDGIVSVVVGEADFNTPFGLCLSHDGGTLYIQTDGNDEGTRNGTTGTIWALNRATGELRVVARNLGRPRGILALADGHIVLSDLVQNTLSLLAPSNGGVTLLAGKAGTAGFANGSGSAAMFSRPYGLAQLPDGSLLVADQNNNAIRQVTLAGVVTTYANAAGSNGNANGPAATATFNAPEDVAVAPDGTVYVADPGNFLIRRISGGMVSTEAGDGNQGFVDATGTAAEFAGLEGIGLTADGSVLWIADGNGGNGTPFNRVRRLKVP